MTLERALARSVKKKYDNEKIVQAPVETEGRAEHLILGEQGERLAARYLSERGYCLIAKNVRYKCGEIDLIARDGDELVFAEVRTRTVGRVLPADCSVGPDKLRKLVLAARTWTEARHYGGFWRVDLIAITLTESGKTEIEHIKNITEAIS